MYTPDTSRRRPEQHNYFTRRQILELLIGCLPAGPEIVVQILRFLLVHEAAEVVADEREAQKVGFETHRMFVEGAPNTVDQHCIISLADLHVADEGEGFLTIEKLQALLADIESEVERRGILPEKVLLIVVGDMVSHSAGDGFPETSSDCYIKAINLLASLPYRKIFLPGNHDKGHSQYQDILQGLSSAGFECLGVSGDIIDLQQATDETPFHLLVLPDCTIEAYLYTQDYFVRLIQKLLILQSQYPLLIFTHNASVLDVMGDGKLLQYLTQHCPLTFCVTSGHTHAGMVGFDTAARATVAEYALRHLPVPYLSQFLAGLYRVCTRGWVHVLHGIGNNRAQTLSRHLQQSFNLPVTVPVPRLAKRIVHFLTFSSYSNDKL